MSSEQKKDEYSRTLFAMNSEGELVRGRKMSRKQSSEYNKKRKKAIQLLKQEERFNITPEIYENKYIASWISKERQLMKEEKTRSHKKETWCALPWWKKLLLWFQGKDKE